MNILKIIPENPGCYLFLNEKKEIIYIGKAKNLKKRVNSYFTNKDLDEKTKALVKNIEDIKFIVTNSEFEAIILENNLIKKHHPKYNIDLRDSKSFSYIEITNEEIPRLIFIRGENLKKNISKGIVFGPFISTEKKDRILDIINKTFQIRTCTKLPKKRCIRHDMGLCSAPCIKNISKEDYLKEVENAKLVLKGKISELRSNLKEQMKKASKETDFEKALKLRKQIEALESLESKQNVERKKNYNENIINYLVKGNKVYLIIFEIYKGILENKKSFEFEKEEKLLDKFITQYYYQNEIPNKLILPTKISTETKEYLKKSKGKNVEIIIPDKGELKDLIQLVEKNIEIEFFQEEKTLEELKNRLNLKNNPKIIECFDISHLGGTEVVASMVQFKDGIANKNEYRKFKIKAKDKNDDFAAIYEVVKRRYYRLKNENKPFPDLVVIDGGMGQLHSAKDALKELKISIPLISLAKKEEEIYIEDGKILQLGNKNKSRLLLQRIRDEAHRFAINYQRQRRKKLYFK